MKKVALMVGVDRYEDGAFRNLRYSVADAAALAVAFGKHGFETHVATNPGNAELLKEVERRTAGLGAGDVFLFFFAGHGYTGTGGEHLLICSDDRLKFLRHNRAGVPVDLLEELTNGKGFHRAFLLDACRTDVYSGGGTRGDETRNLGLVANPDAAKNPGTCCVLMSCDRFCPALEFDDLGHGVFTRAVLDLAEDPATRALPLGEAFVARVRKRMGEILRAHGRDEEQNPTFQTNGEAFALFGECAGVSAGVLEVDRRCVQIEGVPGTARFRYTPREGGTEERVRLTLRNALDGAERACKPRRMAGPGEIKIQLGAQSKGWPTWTVELSVEADGRRRLYVGETEIVVAERGNREAVAAALGPERNWEKVELCETDATPELPPQPEGARTDRLSLRWSDGRRLYVFGGRTVRFGRDYPPAADNDFTLRPPRGGDLGPYRKISAAHCRFEADGDGVKITDGGEKKAGTGEKPSTNGTWWNGRRMAGSVRLEAGETGEVGFGAPAAFGGVGLTARTRGPAWRCGGCPAGGCGGAGRATLELERRDGGGERFLALWGCFGWGNADAAAAGAVVYRKDGAFAWRRGDECGWLVPGGEGPAWLGGAEIGTEGNWPAKEKSGKN